MRFGGVLLPFLLFFAVNPAHAQSGSVFGTVRDETGGSLPGTIVEIRDSSGSRRTEADASGSYRFDGLTPPRAQLLFTLVNFATMRRDVTVPSSGSLRVDAVLYLALNADVTVTQKSTFTNLADAENPAENLIGIAQSASQG